jgi:hypothetical protein
LKVAINRNLESQLLKERAFFQALKATVARDQTESTATTRRILAGFVASHPQVSVMHQQILISLARYTFLLEVQVQANYEKDKDSRKQIDFVWLTLEKIASCGPSASSLTNWVTDLAKEQFIIFSSRMANANVFCQSDGGQKGQEVRLFTLWDENSKTQTKHGSICQFWAGLTYTGKTSAAVTEGTNHSFKKFGLPGKKFSGCCGDSGAGTPKPYAKSLGTLGIWHQHAAADSCGLHDLQSSFRPALQYYVGVGGLDLRNAIQLLHTLFALYMEWKKIVRAVWKKLCGTEVMPENSLDTEDALKDVTQVIQEPLVTRWWTIGSLAQFASKYLDFLLLMAKACCNMTKTDVRENIIASNLLSLASSDWILADIYLVAGTAKFWLNPHMRWYQGSDPHIGTPGFLCFHRQVRYFLMIEDLKKMEKS